MDNQRIEELVRMLERSQINVIDFSEGMVHVRLERYPQYLGPQNVPVDPQAAGAGVPPALVAAVATHAAAASAISAAPEAPSSETAADPDAPPSGPEYATIASPMVGVFHPLKKPVTMGDVIKKGTPVCVVEAMKLMNEIVSEEDGVVAWIAPKDGDMVEYGQMLMQIRRPVP